MQMGTCPRLNTRLYCIVRLSHAYGDFSIILLAQIDKLCHNKQVHNLEKSVNSPNTRAKRGRMTEQDSLMASGKARWLLEGGIDELDEGERALLLALANLEEGTGRTITPEEREALDRIAERSANDADDISQAIKHMVEAKAKKTGRLDWSALKRKIQRK